MIKDNIILIQQSIDRVAKSFNRNSAEITLLAVTKQRSVEEIKEIIAGGIYEIGENKVQEAVGKYNLVTCGLQNVSLKWHLIGHLQTNKVKDAVRIFDLIHSVDSLRLGQEINKQAVKIGKIQNILIEINVSGELSKYGIAPQEVLKLVKEIDQLANLKLLGLMTMAPIVDNQEKARSYFKQLKVLFDTINSTRDTSNKLSILSMGMTDDYEAAIKEGSTLVRIGRALFKE